MCATHLYDIVEVVLLSIVHVVGEHFFHFFQIKLPGSAELQKEIILVPWVFSHIILCDPSLEIIEALLLMNAHITDISRVTYERKLCLTLFCLPLPQLLF